MSDKRLEALEAKVAFLEDSLETISDEFFEQQKELMNLRGQYAKLASQIRSMSESNKSEELSYGLQDEKPPHY